GSAPPPSPWPPCTGTTPPTKSPPWFWPCPTPPDGSPTKKGTKNGPVPSPHPPRHRHQHHRPGTNPPSHPGLRHPGGANTNPTHSHRNRLARRNMGLLRHRW